MGTTPIATAITDVNGNYSLTLPSGFSGPVLLTSIGGTYVDDVTGQTVQAGALSVLLPSASGNVTAEMTPLTSLAAQLALQVAQATGEPAATVATLLNSELGSYFGLTNLTGTPLVNVNTANCAASATQASIDTSLVLAGLAQLAANNGVTSTALVEALINDIASDGQLDGAANGTPITVPLASGTGTVLLSTIENNAGSLTQTVLAAITQFQSSTANTCTAQASTPLKTALAAAATAFPPAPGAEQIAINGTISGLNIGASAILKVSTTGLVNTSPDADLETGFCGQSGCPGVAFTITGSGSFGPSSAGAPDAGFTGYNLTVRASDPQNETCSLASSDTGAVPSNATFVEINGISINCGTRTYPVSVQVSGLNSGQSLTFENELANPLVVSANGLSTFSAAETYGSAYSVTISTPPATETCTIEYPAMASGTINGGILVYVSCGTSPTSLLNNPNGLLLSPDNTLLYLANAGENDILVYNISRNSSGTVTALTQATEITGADIVNPTRLAFDPTGEYLFVTNLGVFPSNGWVSVYDTFNANAEVTADKLDTASVIHPLGVAVDNNGNVYVADNSSGEISVFQPKSGGGYQEASFSPISEDGAGNTFSAPGAISYYGVVGGNYLLIGGEGLTYLYEAPFTKASIPLYTVTHTSCTTFPTGVTGYALHVGGIPVGPSSDSSLFISDYYGADVVDYTAASFFTGGTCPTPAAKTAPISGSFPEGVAIDAFGNLFVSDSGTNALSVYEGPYSGSPVLTVH